MRIALIVFAVLAAVYLVAAFATVDRRSDTQQIGELISDGRSAAQNRDLAGVVSLVSRNYTDESGFNYDRLRILIANAMREETDYSVEVSNRRVEIDGDKADVDLYVVLKRSGGNVFYERDLKLILTKESARHLFIVPTSVWRVVSSNFPSP